MVEFTQTDKNTDGFDNLLTNAFLIEWKQYEQNLIIKEGLKSKWVIQLLFFLGPPCMVISFKLRAYYRNSTNSVDFCQVRKQYLHGRSSSSDMLTSAISMHMHFKGNIWTFQGLWLWLEDYDAVTYQQQVTKLVNLECSKIFCILIFCISKFFFAFWRQ